MKQVVHAEHQKHFGLIPKAHKGSSKKDNQGKVWGQVQGYWDPQSSQDSNKKESYKNKEAQGKSRLV